MAELIKVTEMACAILLPLSWVTDSRITVTALLWKPPSCRAVRSDPPWFLPMQLLLSSLATIDMRVQQLGENNSGKHFNSETHVTLNKVTSSVACTWYLEGEQRRRMRQRHWHLLNTCYCGGWCFIDVLSHLGVMMGLKAKERHSCFIGPSQRGIYLLRIAQWVSG